MSDIGSKAEHVRREARKGQPRDHECHAKGCPVQVPPAFLMCPRHWKMVPRKLQARVWATYQAGQERGDAPVTDEYIEAQQAAVNAVAEAEAKKAARPKQGKLPL